MNPGYFSIESPTHVPSDVDAGVVLRDGVLSQPIGASFWRAGTLSRREAVLNRRILCAQLGIDQERLCFVGQTHGTTIVERNGDTSLVAADGQWSAVPGLYLVANIADCCPVVLFCERPRRVALLHSGWRGTAEGIVPKLLDTWRRSGAAIDRVSAWIGPCADGDRYEVGPEVATRFAHRRRCMRPSSRREGHVLLDIPAVICEQLVETGISLAAIERSANRTISDRRYHSYRRDGFASGRMIAFAALR